jgi:hypothetical protein
MSISREVYIEKRAAGVCVSNVSCQEPAVDGSVFCAFHYERRKDGYRRIGYSKKKPIGCHHKSCSCDTCQDERQALGEPKCTRCQLRGHTADQCDLHIDRFAARRHQESCHIGRFE